MDSHVRWFRRKVGLALVRRLGFETLLVVTAAVAAVVVTGGATERAIVAAVVPPVLFPPIRWGLACLTNPIGSAYLTEWNCPSRELISVPQENLGSSLDTSLNAVGLLFYDAYSPLGGSTTSVYGSEEALLAVTSGEEDIQVISSLVDGRLCVSTTLLIPPHERLIINHQARTDVSELLASHRDLMVAVESAGTAIADADPRALVDLLSLEWEAWQQVGPLLSPVVDVDQRLNLSMLTVRVPSSDVLARGMANAPFVETTPPPARPEPLPSRDSPARVEIAAADELARTPFTALAALHLQSELAANRTDRALAVGAITTPPHEEIGQPEETTL